MNLDNIKEIEEKLEPVFKNIDEICYQNSQKVLKAFWQVNIGEQHFN